MYTYAHMLNLHRRGKRECVLMPPVWVRRWITRCVQECSHHSKWCSFLFSSFIRREAGNTGMHAGNKDAAALQQEFIKPPQWGVTGDCLVYKTKFYGLRSQTCFSSPSALGLLWHREKQIQLLFLFCLVASSCDISSYHAALPSLVSFVIHLRV